jgi:adenosine deaminase CECR1
MSRLPDEEWEIISQDLPGIDEPFLQKYLHGRNALIAEEKKQRSGEYSRALIFTHV